MKSLEEIKHENNFDSININVLAALKGVVEAADFLVRNLPECEIELTREAWGNTNTNIVLKRRNTFAAALKELNERNTR